MRIKRIIMKYVYWYWHNYVFLAVMVLFVFGLLLFRKFVKPPKGLIFSSFISYVLLLICFLPLFGLQIPKLMYLYLSVIMVPSYCITACIAALIKDGPTFFLQGGWWDGARYYIAHESSWKIVSYLVAFSINTLCIFAIIRLILYINRKVSAKKPQVKQTV